MAKVFFSYSHTDEALRDQLERQLSVMKRQGVIDVWHDRKIGAGEDLNNEIDRNLESADIILLLVSTDFLASDYCYNREMTRSLERHEEKSAIVIPVILRACPWHDAPFGKLMATPTDGKPVTKWLDRDEAFLEVANAIKGAVKRINPVATTPPAATTSPRATTPPAKPPADEAPAHRQRERTPQGGWVRDLLTGASREEDAAALAAVAKAPRAAPSPLQVVESLNSLSVDIARAIDHDASIELWDRYRRGERDVFTRRLYTLNGQQTFDEVRRQYQSEGDFRAAVDHYCEDFERLLKDVARNDRDNVITQTYLTSDTGKVYTLLAHASGRLL